MTIINRYNNTIQGSLIMTGNTLGLLRTNNTLNPGTNGSGPGAWITVDTTLATPATWVSVVSLPNGENVTYNWQNCSSSAVLTIPAGSTVKHAELMWSGLSVAGPGGLDLSAFLNNPITLVNPAGTSFSVTPDTTTKQFWVAGGNQTYYSIASNITNVMSNGLSGKYTVKGVPSALSAAQNNSTSGWILILAYYNPSEKLRNLNIYTTMEDIGVGNPPVDFNVTGFQTPNTGSPQARVIIAAGDGDVNASGDFIKMGPSVSSLVTLSGPNNFPTNFFCSQINDNLGNLDTSGTFGRINSIAGNPGTPVFASRYGWDITNINASAAITLNQSSAVFRISSSGEGYYVSSIGIQIDSLDQPNLTSMTKTGPSYAGIGETITYTVVAKNEGSTISYNTVLKDTIPNGLTFVSNSVVVNGATVPGASPTTGISLGTLPIASTFTVSFKCTVSSTIPTPNPVVNNAFVTYDYVPVIGAATVVGSAISSNQLTKINHVDLTTTKTSNPAYSKVGATVTYTVLVNNTGSTSATNVLFVDTIPSGTSFINGSFNINGTTISGSPNPPGINVGTLPVGITTLSFNVTIDTIPTQNPIPNNSTTSFNYTVNPSTPNTGAGNSNSNTAYTQINQAKFYLNKEVDKSYAICSDTLKYTISLTNTGNVTAVNVIFKDTIPNGTQFVNDSFTLNDITIPGVNPTIGVNLNTISAGSTSTITFKVEIVC